MAESVYATDLKSVDSIVVWVQVPSLVLNVVEILHFFIKAKMAEYGLMHRTTNAATCSGSVGSNPTLSGLPRKMANNNKN